MRRILGKTILSTALLLLAAGGLFAQNNHFGIDDECHRLYLAAESKLGKPGFREANDALFAKATAIGEGKAICISRYIDAVDSQRRDDAKEDDFLNYIRLTREAALRYGHPQYYYNSYTLAATYYYNRHQSAKAFEILEDAYTEAVKQKSDYGQYVITKLIGDVYGSIGVRNQAKEAYRAAARTWENTDDPLIKRQSPCRIYVDLSTTFHAGSDSAFFYLKKAEQAAITRSDSTRLGSMFALYHAVHQDRERFAKCKKFYEANANRIALNNEIKELFLVAEDILNRGDWSKADVLVENGAGWIAYDYLCALAESYQDKDRAAAYYKILGSMIESATENFNTLYIARLNANREKALLSQEVADKTVRINRLICVILLLVIALFVVILFYVLMRNKERNVQRADMEGMIESLTKANSKALEANEAKSRFLGNMSHEIRTPLNAIVGFSQLLSLPDGTLSQKEKEEYGSYVVNNSKMLTMLVDDILNSSDMVNNNYVIRLEDASINEICRSALHTTQYRVPEGVKSSFTTAFSDQDTLKTDPRRVQQILVNFLTNACKHTAEGEINVDCRADGDVVRFSVSDTGTGVPEDQAETIFERFTKLDAFAQGAGLGLNICRQVSQKLGGDVYLDTSYKGGARFVLDLHR